MKRPGIGFINESDDKEVKLEERILRSSIFVLGRLEKALLFSARSGPYTLLWNCLSRARLSSVMGSGDVSDHKADFLVGVKIVLSSLPTDFISLKAFPVSKRLLFEDGSSSTDGSLDVTSSVSDWPRPLAVIIEYCGLGVSRILLLFDCTSVVLSDRWG